MCDPGLRAVRPRREPRGLRCGRGGLRPDRRGLPRVKRSPSDRYGRAAERSAAVVISEYSTSFGLATRLLSRSTQRHIRNIYALVRVADEIVDGAAASAGLDAAAVAGALDSLEADTAAALGCGYSVNLVVHAFAASAREVGIDLSLVTPFFASMRMDLTRAEHTPESFDAYVYGSAEVVGLMCLRAFVVDKEPPPVVAARLEAGARRLGAAFQKVNFLRDLAADADGLGRAYFPGVRVGELDETTKLRLLDDIDADLAAAAAVLPLLPRRARRAVALAHGLFAELAVRIRATPARQLQSTRVRVPDAEKARLAALAFADRLPVHR